ncbi:MAG: glycosyltransferase family 9 protein [Gemmatimonadetes bacterium]|nr:glycosyltransferase family 9 protein [Gemmatimonadota bacterium]
MSAVVIQTSFLGDVVLTTPLIAELAARGPVDVVTTPAGAALLANHPSLRRLVIYDKRGAARGVRGLYRTAREVAEGAGAGGSPRTAYLAQGSLRSATLAVLAGIPERVGFASSAGRRLYTRRVPYHAEWHHAERVWSLALPSDARPATRAEAGVLRPRLYPGAAERDAVTALLAPLAGDRRPLVALAPGSVWATKRWPAYPALAAALAPNFRLVVIGAGGDSELASAIVAAAPGALDATGRLSLLGSAELIGRAACLVTNDSAPQHLASAMGTPTVAIFGPTVPAFGFGPLAPGSLIAEHDAMPCRPCDRHGPVTCPLGHFKCMREVTPVTVAGLARRAATSPR